MVTVCLVCLQYVCTRFSLLLLLCLHTHKKIILYTHLKRKSCWKNDVCVYQNDVLTVLNRYRLGLVSWWYRVDYRRIQRELINTWWLSDGWKYHPHEWTGDGCKSQAKRLSFKNLYIFICFVLFFRILKWFTWLQCS